MYTIQIGLLDKVFNYFLPTYLFEVFERCNFFIWGSEKHVLHTTSTSSISLIRQQKLHFHPLCDVAGTTCTSASPLRDICKHKLKCVTSKLSSYPTCISIISGSSPGATGLVGTACSFLLLTRSNPSSHTSKSTSDISPSNRINNSASVSVFRLGFI